MREELRAEWSPEMGSELSEERGMACNAVRSGCDRRMGLAEFVAKPYLSAMTTQLSSVPARRRHRFTLAALTAFVLLVPTSSKSQPRDACPRFARVPGYGACTNFAGTGCGFCAYRCNDETVVRWNVCAP